MIRITLKGSFKNSERFFSDAITKLPPKIEAIFHKYGRLGVEVLRGATPRDTGETANSWSYDIQGSKIVWTNSNILTSGVPLAILIQYGHGTRHGGYVQGIDFINPALRPIFDQLAEDCWKEVQNL